MQGKEVTRYKITDHHNVPTSQGGSSDKINISKIEETHHSDFHVWAENQLPCRLIRLLLLHGIGMKNPPPPAMVAEIFEITNRRDMKKLYDSEAFHISSSPQSGNREKKAARFAETHTLGELVAIRHTIHAVTNGGTYPAKQSLFLPRAQSFFQTDSSVHAALSLCTEEDERGRLAWVKPIRDEIRERIIDALEERHALRVRRQEQRQMSHILREQRKIAEQAYDRYRESLRNS